MGDSDAAGDSSLAAGPFDSFFLLTNNLIVWKMLCNKRTQLPFYYLINYGHGRSIAL